MNKTEIIGKKFLDNHGVEHKVTKILGEGGQGLVCLTETPGFVLKFVTDNENLISANENPAAFKYYTAVFKTIRHLPISPKNHLAVPAAILTDYAGYVMRLMEDMTSFSILDDDPETFPATDGHRHRLEVLSKCASILAEIHSNGMVYCDISPNNIFITKDVNSQNQNVWFIDTDNLFIPNKISKGKLVYTPRYAAPELLKKDAVSCTQNSDLYSFAVLAYECLSMIHPFAGKAALGEESAENNWDDSDGWDKSSDKDNENLDVDPIYSGKYPWINDPTDESNHSDKGFPPSLFLTQELFDLFQQTFSDGRKIPEQRPTAFYWQKAFSSASDLTIKCPSCSMSFIYDSQHKCPWCEAEIPHIVTISSENKIVFSRELYWKENSSSSNEILVPERIFLPY